MKKFVAFFKNMFQGVLKGNIMSMTYFGMFSWLPMFLYSIIGTSVFHLSITGYSDIPLILHIISLPGYLLIAYVIFYGILYVNIIKRLFKKKK